MNLSVILQFHSTRINGKASSTMFFYLFGAFIVNETNSLNIIFPFKCSETMIYSTVYLLLY